MEPDTAELIGRIIGTVENFERVIWFGAHLIWLTIYYILFQMFRLKFLKLLIVAEVVGIIYWIWLHLYYFTGVPAEQNNSLGYLTIYWSIETILRITPLILGTMGGICGLRYLQEKWKQSKPPTSA